MIDRNSFVGNAGPERRAALVRAAAIGTVASVAVHGALAYFGRRAGRSAIAPINATSHIVHGPDAGALDRIDVPHTVVGATINHGASIFWALPLAWWLTKDRHLSAADICMGAAATGAIAGAVDYGLVPRRLSPGWHHALPAKSVAGSFGALAAGLAAGALLLRFAEARRTTA